MRTLETVDSRSKLRRVLLAGLGAGLVLAGLFGMFLPIAPGIPLLIAGAFVLSRECPPIHRILEKYQARFPVVQRYVLVLARWYQTWRAPASETKILVVPTVNQQEENRRLPSVPCGVRQNSDCGEPDYGGLKILIFDPDLEDLAWHAAPFESLGFEVYKCMSIEAALRCIEREQLDFALVDQGSAAFEGLRVIRHLIRYNLHTPFIVLARQEDALCYQQALSLGAVDYLQKQIPVAAMKWLIDRYFGISTKAKRLRGAVRC